MIGYSLLQTGMKTNVYVRTNECESECIHTNDNTNTHTHMHTFTVYDREALWCNYQRRVNELGQREREREGMTWCVFSLFVWQQCCLKSFGQSYSVSLCVIYIHNCLYYRINKTPSLHVSPSPQLHTFLNMPWCDLCHNFLWGLRSQGYKCKGTAFRLGVSFNF